MQVDNVQGHYSMRRHSQRVHPHRMTMNSRSHCTAEAGHSVVRGGAGKPSPMLIIGIVLAVALIAVIPHVFSMALTPPAAQYVEVTVLPGQTLWEIAGEHKGERTDTRRMVDRIRTANELSNASVYPGQVLRIPVAP